MAEMLIEPGAPHRTHRVARLQHRAQARAGATTQETEMAAVPARHQLDDGVGLAVPAHTQDDTLVGPFHSLQSNLRPAFYLFRARVCFIASGRGGAESGLSGSMTKQR